jgi:hypothetical protein
MNKYYLHENKTTVGPFSIEDLKAKKITAFTPIWCEGFENWKTAGEIDALKPILSELPSPQKLDSLDDKKIYAKPKETLFGYNKKGFITFIIALFIILFTLILMNYQSNKIITIEKTNKEVQKENFLKKIEEQKQKLEEQQKILSEKEQVEKDRFNKGRRQADENTYKEIISALSNSYAGLEDAKNDLEKAKGYRLFRSAKKKEQQIMDAEYEIEIWKRKIELLKLEKREVENRLKN